jgi:2-keto-4-pentenoate hydratase
MLDDDAVHDAARRLLAAERSREPIRQLSLQYPDMTIEDAYRVQRALVAVKLAEGREVEVAFVLGHPLKGPGVTADFGDLGAATCRFR